MKIVIPEDAVTREVWITRAALRTGIVKTEAAVLKNGTVIVSRPGKDGKTILEHLRKDEWYYTYDKAVANAEKMRKNRVAGLLRQITRLNGLVFEQPE